MHRLQDAGRDPRAADGLSSARNDLRAWSARVDPVRTGRFAPTPSGTLHQGSLVASLASRCDALAHGYAWRLRIDDIDPPRTLKGAEDNIVQTLGACGFQWDDDVIHQSLHAHRYHQALNELIPSGRVFQCRCSRRQCGPEGRCIAGCRDNELSDDLSIASLSGDSEAFSLRLCVLQPPIDDPSGTTIHFTDGICGEQACDPAQSLGDIVLRRRDGPWSYALACSVDDSDGITDVVRGADLLQATFAQLSIMSHLGRNRPQYAHVPVARDAQGRKLGKQTSAPPIDAAQALPSLMQAWHFLGQSFRRNATPSTLEEFWRWATDDWSIERVPATSGSERLD